MQLTKKCKIIPNNDQIDVLWKISNLSTQLYNYALADRQYVWNNENISVSYVDQQNKLPAFKEQYPEFKQVYSKVLQGVLKKLDANYRSFDALRKNNHVDARPPRFRSRNYFMTIVYNQSGFRVCKNTIAFSHEFNSVPLTFTVTNELINDLKIKQIDIYNDHPYKGRGSFFLSVIYDVEPIEYKNNNIYQAIDLGINKIVTAVNTQGKFFEKTTPRPDKYWNPKINAAKSKRDHCKGVNNGSNKSKKYKRIDAVINKMSKKISNQNKDFHHKLSHKMVNNTKANTIIVGDLEVKYMAHNQPIKGLNRATQNQGHLARFVRFLTYKAELIGKRVIRIDEKYTSKECYVCGKRHDIPLSVRIMKCDCGNFIDRDQNSAINIMKKYLSQNALWTGYKQFACNLRQTGLLTYK